MGYKSSKVYPFTVSISVFFLLILLILTVVNCSCRKEKSRTSSEALHDMYLKQELEDTILKGIHKELYENPTLARQKALQILMSPDSANLITKIISLKHIGSSYLLETNYAEAIKYYSKALSISEHAGLHPETANISNNLGVIYNEMGDFKTAYMYLVEALNYYDLAGQKEKKIGALNNIGLIFIKLKNYEKALTFLEEVFKPQSQPKDSILIASVLNNIALCYINSADYSRANENLDSAIKISERINNQYGLCISHQLRGNVYLDLNDIEKAFNAYNLSIDIARQGNWPFQSAVSRLGIAKGWLKAGKISDALKIAVDVLNLANSQESMILKSEALMVLSDIFKKSGDYKKSLEYFQEHIAVQQDGMNESVIHQIYDIESKYLSQLNKMQQLEIEKRELAISNKNNLLIFMSLIFMLLLVGLYLLYLNFRHIQKVKLQKTVIDLTEKKAIAAFEAEVQERKRIGHELHDSLGHLLSLAGLHASVLYNKNGISDEKRKELLKSLIKSIDDAFDEVRNISHNLAPSLLSERGLEGALKTIGDRVNQSAKLSMSFNTFGLNEKMNILIENTLFRTIQEIVNNTIKHAEATKLYIQITQGNDEISLITEDNGKGFNLEDVQGNGSYGLSHMKSRIENLKGTMFVDSQKGRGTIISILIPL